MATPVVHNHVDPRTWGIGFWVAVVVLIADIILVAGTHTLNLPEGLVIAAICSVRL